MRDGFRIFDKYIDSKKTFEYASNFSYIINATYAAYARTLLRDSVALGYFQTFGANGSVFLNKAYKLCIPRFQENILKAILKKEATKENFDKYIKGWGREAAMSLINKLKEKVERLKAAHK